MITIDNEEARDLYESDLMLIRPDQIVAWRHIAESLVDPADVLAHALGGRVNGGTQDQAMKEKATGPVRCA